MNMDPTEPATTIPAGPFSTRGLVKMIGRRAESVIVLSSFCGGEFGSWSGVLVLSSSCGVVGGGGRGVLVDVVVLVVVVEDIVGSVVGEVIGT